MSTKKETTTPTTTSTPAVEVVKKKPRTRQYIVRKPYDVTATHMSVTLNGRTTMIKYDTMVELDKNLIEVIENSLRLEKEANDYSNNRA